MKRNTQLSSFLLGLFISVIVIFSALGGAIADRLFVIRPLDQVFPRQERIDISNDVQKGEVINTLPINTENAIVQVADQSELSVVTVSIKQDVPRSSAFSLPGLPFYFEVPNGPTEQVQRDIGTGFVVSQEDGLVVTNKHVVSDVEAAYILIDNEGQEHAVTNIYRDPRMTWLF